MASNSNNLADSILDTQKKVLDNVAHHKETDRWKYPAQ